MKGTRADVRLLELGLAESREKARSLIMSGAVTFDGVRVDKPGDNVPPDAILAVKENPVPFVSRGGLKLDKAV
ncbi:MAG: TlyA family rRNA (cytidine-2'-O)-methyltransferase, partial [Clostridiales bacterium]|nr:TlyA family rRNA (cytidine-2'-O)-methyltransferase [Clostridiales bacterium]